MSCPDRNLAVFHHYRHYEGLRLLPSVCDSKLIQQTLFKYCFRDSFPELHGGTRELSKIFFDKIPVKLVSLEQNEIFRKIVNSVQSDYTIEQTKYIDTLLFDLYNLTTEERKVIGYVEIK